MFGGPSTYTESLGGYEHMLAQHLNLGITPEHLFRFASLMSLAADDASLPADPEFRSALVAYLEWGTRLAMENSQPDAQVAEHAPVPRWGWGEAPPYQPEARIDGLSPPTTAGGWLIRRPRERRPFWARPSSINSGSAAILVAAGEAPAGDHRSPLPRPESSQVAPGVDGSQAER